MAAVNQENASLILIVPIQLFVKTLNVEIHVNRQRLADQMPFAEQLDTLFHVDAHQILKVTRKCLATKLNAVRTMNVMLESHA